MKKIVAYGATHFILLAIYTMKVTHGSWTMYNILTTTTRNSTVRILHATFLIFLMCSLAGLVIDRVFKSLRPEEISNFNESLLYFLTDFLLVVSTFDSDVSFRNGLLFVMLLCVKSLNWLLVSRIKRNVYPSLYGLAYGISLFSGLMVVLFTLSCISSITGQILFLFEYTLLVIASIKNICVMNLIQSDDDGKRSLYNFYIDIAYMSIMLLVYALFIGITSINYRLPLNLFRSALTILDALISKVKMFLSYLRLCKELEKCVEGSGDGFCAICRDDMEVGKKLACGHCFHIECLKMWCEQQQTCPICKSKLAFDVKKESFVVGNEYISGIPVTIDG